MTHGAQGLCSGEKIERFNTGHNRSKVVLTVWSDG